MTDNHAYNQTCADKRHGENFPVASWLMPEPARSAVIAFYDFARHADDIADEDNVPQEHKLCLLNAIDNAVTGGGEVVPEWAQEYMKLVVSGKLDNRHGRALLQAFSQDVAKSRYGSWQELIDYCMHSAAPVGRAVLELHRQPQADIEASDALCNVLQIINHLQDLKSDYCQRDRVYFPLPWFDNIEDLAKDSATNSVRKMINKALDEVDIMLENSKHLPYTLRRRRLRMEIATIYHVARLLAAKLRKNDPIKQSVKLSKMEYIKACTLGGASLFHLPERAAIARIIHNSKSSFFRPLLSLSKEKQGAMFALYGFCRHVDDAVDDAENHAQAVDNIVFWRSEIEALYSDDIALYPTHPVTRSLLPYVKQYGLKRCYFDEIIAGMQMDNEGVLKPSLAVFDNYCYRVASCVGHLCVGIFGEDNAIGHDFADSLGKALQTINIMRDVYEDAQIGRIYLPQEILAKYGLETITAQDIVTNLEHHIPALQNVLRDMGEIAHNHLDTAYALITVKNRKNLRPALAMAAIYQRHHKAIIRADYIVSR